MASPFTSLLPAMCRRLLLGLAAAGPMPAQEVPGAFQPRFDYLAEYRPAGPQLDVHLAVQGLNPGLRDVRFRLSEAGEWVDVDSLYIRALRSNPPAHRDPDSPTQWVLTLPDDWTGSIDVSYSIPLIEFGSALNQRHGLLPWYVPDDTGAPAYAIGLADNTLMRVLVDGAAVSGPRTVTLSAGDQTICSGWSGQSQGRQTIALPTDLDDSPLAFGRSPRALGASHAGIQYEVVQFSATPDATEAVMALARSLIPSYGNACGRAIDRPVRVFITDKGGGQWMDRGIMMQAASEGQADSPHYKHLVAHELFHQWLGGYAGTPDESTVWFKEGFTDYLSLWHLAATGLIDRDWFVTRLVDLDAEARRSTAFGHLAFGDLDANWRDGDGPAETLAYKGGAMLAFFADCELRKQGGRGLSQMIGDLGRPEAPPYTTGTIRNWMQEHGLAEFCSAYIDAPALPDLDDALASIGFDRVQSLTDLTYTGIQTEGDSVFGAVTGIDPEGPAAATGLTVGDRITGFWPTRSDRPAVGPSARTPLGFGLEWFEPGAEVNIGVRRGDQDMTFTIRPRRIAGGVFTSYREDPAKTRDFFGKP